ncbi:MAG: epoxyqueuosine reductase QueH [Candidatus Falkowbacteria bacterium]
MTNLFNLQVPNKEKKVLLHSCCAPCSCAILRRMVEGRIEPTVYFYNPNIDPLEEYERRLAETKRIASELGLPLLIESVRQHDNWLALVKGHETDPERGARCIICYRDRLGVTGRKAEALGFDYFGSTLTVSPHKSAAAVNQVGQEVAEQVGVLFLARDYKKQNGCLLATQLSKELGVYRQDYCGCQFSMRK